MENSKIIIAYLIYLPIVIALTIYVSKMLFKNGKLFMIDIFKGKEDIALATNKLFEIGLYLINIGWAMLILTITYQAHESLTYQSIIEILSKKRCILNLIILVMWMNQSSLKTTELFKRHRQSTQVSSKNE